MYTESGVAVGEINKAMFKVGYFVEVVVVSVYAFTDFVFERTEELVLVKEVYVGLPFIKGMGLVGLHLGKIIILIYIYICIYMCVGYYYINVES